MEYQKKEARRSQALLPAQKTATRISMGVSKGPGFSECWQPGEACLSWRPSYARTEEAHKHLPWSQPQFLTRAQNTDPTVEEKF